MFFYFKYIKLLALFCFVNFAVLFSFNVGASECGILQLQNNRSSGVSVSLNQCDELPNISTGTVFDLAARGRLWLKSTSFDGGENGFQMICQNRTGRSVQLDFSSPFLPWLKLDKLSNCSGWVDNKLSCDGNDGVKHGLHCVLAFYKPVLRSRDEKIERTSSVKMRSLNSIDTGHAAEITADDKALLLEALHPELKICKKLNNIFQTVRIDWDVQMAHVINFRINAPGVQVSADLVECLDAIITTMPYPVSSRKESFVSIF